MEDPSLEEEGLVEDIRRVGDPVGVHSCCSYPAGSGNHLGCCCRFDLGYCLGTWCSWWLLNVASLHNLSSGCISPDAVAIRAGLQ